MDHIDYRIYRDSDLHAVTQMWRESRDGWPPGFFGASDISPGSIEQEEKSSGKLFTVLAFQDERVVGYCRTSPYGGEPEAAYVDLLNAVPDKHGKGIGKALLLDAVTRSAEAGLTRLDLHTWPANMKAVPLYKKTGFFWVPDTEVYMQNYMPFLLGRREFREFIGGSDWYSLFRRELEVEPDLQKARSGRHVYRYSFHKDGKTLTAEFDRQGRSLSLLKCPGFTAGLSTDRDGEYFAGRPVTVSLTGTGFAPETVKFSSAGSLPFSRLSEDVVRVTPSAVRVPVPVHDPAERITALVGDLELGIGMLTREEVNLHRSSFRYLPQGAESVTLGVRSLGNVSSASVSYSVDGGENLQKVFSMSESTYQSLVLEIPPLERGVHRMTVQIGRAGYEETVVLICGVPAGEPVGIDTRSRAVVVFGELVMTVARKGGRVSLFNRDEHGDSRRVGGFFLCAGPPSWNSDLPKQNYDLEVLRDTVRASTLWPSRPGMEHGFTAVLDGAGFARCTAWVRNGSESSQKISFRARNDFAGSMEPKTDLIPVEEGMLSVRRVYNQVPDWDEDLSPRTDWLGAPWHGTTGGGLAVMDYFPGWSVLEYDVPGTEEAVVEPGDTLESPQYRMLCCRGGSKEMLSRAEALGWKLGDWRRTTGFEQTNLKPVMESGATVFLTHPLHGERKGVLSLSGEEICSGSVCRGKRVSGTLSGEGLATVTVTMADRDTVQPVFLVSPESRVSAKEEGERLLVLENERLRAEMDPMAFGQVFSVLLDGKEYLLASRPEPSEFAWEKPWYGGIHPRYMVGHARPFKLNEQPPTVEKFSGDHCGEPLSGWRMTWSIDHKDFGTSNLIWKVGMYPEVPVIFTELDCSSPEGEYLPGELDVRAFLKPGGSVEGSVLTCESAPGLREGRDHAGAWVSVGDWGRVQRGGSFVELLSTGHGVPTADDYADRGCHLSIYSSHERERVLRGHWIFGSTVNDQELAEVFRAHR